jgi:hypothetical protein
MKFSTKLRGELVQLIAMELKETLKGEEVPRIDELENGLFCLLQGVGRESLGGCLEVIDERLHQVAQSEGKRLYRRVGQVLSAFGEVKFRRGYYVCLEGQSYWYALDGQVGLKAGQATPRMAELLAMSGVLGSFEQGQEVVKRFLQVEVSANTILNYTHQKGERQLERQAEWIEQSQDEAYLQLRQRSANTPVERLYGAVDGVFVPLEGQWIEGKVVNWFHAGREYGEEDLKALNIGRYIDMDGLESFEKLCWATAVHHQADLAKEVVFVGDGAPWIWKLIARLFPHAVQIVDWYHACEHIGRFAQELYPHDSEERTTWYEQVRSWLWEGEVPSVIAACLAHQSNASLGPLAQQTATYFKNNATRMDYARFRQQGYFIGSGTVESSCKQIVTMRLKIPGARWTHDGAKAVAAARTAWLNHQWDQVPLYPLAA